MTRDGTIRKVAASGGPVSIVARDVISSGGTPSWGDDNSIVYVNTAGDLVRLGPAGEPPQILLKSGSAGIIRGPKLLPGGGAVMYVTCSKEPAVPGVCVDELRVLDIVKRQSKPLLMNARRAWYVPGGYLVFGSEEKVLYGVNFDLATLTVSGAPVALLDGMMVNFRGSSRISVASQAGAMAYLPGGDVAARIIVQVDRSGREETILATPRPYDAPRLSPDGQRIILQIAADKGANQLWVHDRASATTRQLTFEGNSSRPDLSPDGQRVAFGTQRPAGKRYIWSVPLDGSSAGERVGTGIELRGAGAVSWTRDGKWIVTDGQRDGPGGDGSEDLYAIPTSGAAREMIPLVATPADEEMGQVSPDGRWLAYLSNDVGGRYQLYLTPFMRTGNRTLVSAGAANEPAWTSNEELAYVSDTDSLVVAQLTFGPSITVTRTTLFDHGPFRSGGRSFRGYDVSRDGKRFVFVREQRKTVWQPPVVILNWHEEVKRLMTSAGEKQ